MSQAPKLSPASILSQYNCMGYSAINFLYGKHYYELYRSMFQLGFMQYSLYFDDWQPPIPMDFGYAPDQYELLLDGPICVQFKSPHVFTDTPMRLIHVQGGLGKYLSRLNSKKRSEFRRCFTASSSQPIKNAYVMDKIFNEVCEQHYAELSTKNPAQVFDGSHNTRLASAYMVQYVALNDKCLQDRTANAFLLPIHDKETNELLCYTHCVASLDNRVLYCLLDSHRSDNYNAKSATIANIEWASENGFHYVDIDNHIYQPGLFELADQSSVSKLSYKNMFFTGTVVRDTYFSTQEALDTFKTKLSVAIQPPAE